MVERSRSTKDKPVGLEHVLNHTGLETALQDCFPICLMMTLMLAEKNESVQTRNLGLPSFMD